MPRNDLIQLRSDTAANWASVNPVLAIGEAGFETDTGKLKIGTGSTAWNSLLYTTDASDITGTTLAPNVVSSSLTSVGTLTSLRTSGSANIGSNSWTKTSLGAGEIALDNGAVDSPGILFYYANNKNWGIDTYYNGANQILRFVTDLNETGGTIRAYVDTSGNMVATTFRGTSAGSVLKDTMLSNTEMTVVSTTIAATSSNVDFITYSYTPVSSSSYLIIHFHCSRYIPAGTTDDSWFSILKAAGNEIAYGWQKVNDDGTGTSGRSGVLFPLTGRYTNSSTNAVTIAVAARRDTADDSITIDNSSTALWLRITEVAR